MTFTFPCPHCNRNLKSENKYVGRTSKCPNCRESVIVPAAEAEHTPNTDAATLGQLYYKQGDDYFSRKDIKNALVCYEKAVKYGNTEAVQMLAVISMHFHMRGEDYFKNEQYKEAIEWYDKVIQYGNDSQKAIAFHYRGKCYFILDDWDKADDDFFMATGIDKYKQHLSQSMCANALYWRGYALFKSRCEGKKIPYGVATEFSLISDLLEIKNYLREAINIGCSAPVQSEATQLLQQIERTIPFCNDD